MAHLHLVQGANAAAQAPTASVDVVRCLRDLLRRAEAGEIVGLSYAGMDSDCEIFYSSCGEAHRNPVVAAGLSSTLHHGTMKRMFGGA
ncbi:MAG: hypothetical protein J7598_03510 [Mitsuaria chitosanitabida]|uniref:hypothetical protein n=1 Tax=Roseateles chitosanitabidus TaxID=65048 RepID=UPI001AFF7ED4|nr:hypothetical protein [Roseateles chitosanitabidus]MBO9685657.1 hypothetical protein [Roseateles chitosanitabidus]